MEEITIFMFPCLWYFQLHCCANMACLSRYFQSQWKWVLVVQQSQKLGLSQSWLIQGTLHFKTLTTSECLDTGSQLWV